MKFVDEMKLGVSFYIGWTFAKALDRVLGNPKKYLDEVKTRRKMMEKESKLKEKRIIGFHM